MNNKFKIIQEIEKIDILLTDDEKLDSFIDELEESNISYMYRPKQLKKEIIRKINGKPKYDVKNIVKIACFALLCTILWECSFARYENVYASKEETKENIEIKESSYLEKVDNDFRSFSDRFMKFDQKRGEE